MKLFQMGMFFLAMQMLSGCATTALWREGAGNEYLQVVPKRSGEDVEFDLKDSGREYYCRDMGAPTYLGKVCYAKLSKEDEIKNIQVKLFKTPETIVIDTVQTVLVIGYAALESLARSGYHRG